MGLGADQDAGLPEEEARKVKRALAALVTMALFLTAVASVPDLASGLSAAQSPSAYLLTKAAMPRGWDRHSLSGSGIPTMVSLVCPAKDQRTGACSAASTAFAGSGGLPEFLEALVNFTTPGTAQSMWGLLAGDLGGAGGAVSGLTRTMLGHFGTASRTWAMSRSGGTGYLTVIRKDVTLAVVEYLDRSGPMAVTDAAYWDSAANAMVPPRGKVPSTTTTTATTVATTTTTTAPTTTVTTTPHVGSTLRFQDEYGNPYTVELTQVIDGAGGADQFTTPNAGDRFVAIVFQITNIGTSEISGDANADTTVVGSDNQDYSVDFFDEVSECTNFNNGEYQISSGGALTGCVVFQVPVPVKVTQVQWSPSGGFGDSFGAWDVP